MNRLSNTLGISNIRKGVKHFDHGKGLLQVGEGLVKLVSVALVAEDLLAATPLLRKTSSLMSLSRRANSSLEGRSLLTEGLPQSLKKSWHDVRVRQRPFSLAKKREEESSPLLPRWVRSKTSVYSGAEVELRPRTTALAREATGLEKQEFKQFVQRELQVVTKKVHADPFIRFHTDGPPQFSWFDVHFNDSLAFARNPAHSFVAERAKVTDAWILNSRVILKVRYDNNEFLFFRSTGMAKKAGVPIDRYYVTGGVTYETNWVTKGPYLYGAEVDPADTVEQIIATHNRIPFYRDMAAWLDDRYTAFPPTL